MMFSSNVISLYNIPNFMIYTSPESVGKKEKNTANDDIKPQPSMALQFCGQGDCEAEQCSDITLMLSFSASALDGG